MPRRRVGKVRVGPVRLVMGGWWVDDGWACGVAGPVAIVVKIRISL